MGAAPCLVFLNGRLQVPQTGRELGVRAHFMGRSPAPARDLPAPFNCPNARGWRSRVSLYGIRQRSPTRIK